MATEEEDDDYVAMEEEEDYVATQEEEEEEDDYDDEYGFLSDLCFTDCEDDEMASLSNFNLLKVPAEAYKDLSLEEKVRWMTAHFLIQNGEPRRGRESKKEEQVSKGEEQVSKVEEESKVAEEEDGDVEESSKVPKTNDDDGGCGPRGTSWKRSGKPGGV